MRSILILVALSFAQSRPIPGETLVQLAVEVADTPAQMEAGAANPKVQFDMNATPKNAPAAVDESVMPEQGFDMNAKPSDSQHEHQKSPESSFDMNQPPVPVKSSPDDKAEAEAEAEAGVSTNSMEGPTPEPPNIVSFLSLPLEESDESAEADMMGGGRSPSNTMMPETVAHGANADNMEPRGHASTYDEDEGPVAVFDMNSSGGASMTNAPISHGASETMNRGSLARTHDMMNERVSTQSVQSMNEGSGVKDMTTRSRIVQPVYVPPSGPDAMQLIAGKASHDLDLFDEQQLVDEKEDEPPANLMPEALSNQNLADTMESNVKVTQVIDFTA